MIVLSLPSAFFAKGETQVVVLVLSNSFLANSVARLRPLIVIDMQILSQWVRS